MENWKDIVEEKDCAFKARLVPLFLMDQGGHMDDKVHEVIMVHEREEGNGDSM
jgi:hypothetical protein